jgi:hypothetical protein
LALIILACIRHWLLPGAGTEKRAEQSGLPAPGWFSLSRFLSGMVTFFLKEKW